MVNILAAQLLWSDDFLDFLFKAGLPCTCFPVFFFQLLGLQHERHLLATTGNTNGTLTKTKCRAMRRDKH